MVVGLIANITINNIVKDDNIQNIQFKEPKAAKNRKIFNITNVLYKKIISLFEDVDDKYLGSIILMYEISV